MFVNPTEPEDFFTEKVIFNGKYLKVKFPPYSEPVDLYLAIITPDSQLLLLTVEGTWDVNLVPFAIGQTEAIRKRIDLDNVTFSEDIPNFTYRDWAVYWIVVPTNGGSFGEIDGTRFEFGFYDVAY